MAGLQAEALELGDQVLDGLGLADTAGRAAGEGVAGQHLDMRAEILARDLRAEAMGDKRGGRGEGCRAAEDGEAGHQGGSHHHSGAVSLS